MAKERNEHRTTQFLLVLVIILLLVAIVGVFSGTAVGEARLFTTSTGDGGGGSSFINAHACQADNVCETKGLTATSKVGIGTTSPQTKLHIKDDSDASIFLDSNNAASVQIGANNNVVGSLSIIGSQSVGEHFIYDNGYDQAHWTIGLLDNSGKLKIWDQIYARELISIEHNGITIGTPQTRPPMTATGDVTVEGILHTQHDIVSLSLMGNGTAYACVDSSGTLYRSTSPCV